jgi:hypothetical protein
LYEVIKEIKKEEDWNFNKNNKAIRRKKDSRNKRNYWWSAPYRVCRINRLFIIRTNHWNI